MCMVKTTRKRKSLSDSLVVLALFVVPFSIHFDPCIQPIFVHFSLFRSILIPFGPFVHPFWCIYEKGKTKVTK